VVIIVTLNIKIIAEALYKVTGVRECYKSVSRDELAITLQIGQMYYSPTVRSNKRATTLQICQTCCYSATTRKVAIEKVNHHFCCTENTACYQRRLYGATAELHSICAQNRYIQHCEL